MRAICKQKLKILDEDYQDYEMDISAEEIS